MANDDEKIITLYPNHEPGFTELAPGSLENSFTDQDSDEDETEQQRDDLENVLPTPLHRRMIGCYLFAGAVTVASIVFSIYFRQPRLLLGILVAGYVAYIGYSMRRDYFNGDILEVVLICSSVAARPLRNTTKVIFRTDDEIPDYYSFIVPKKWAEDFAPNVAYLIYFNAKTPSQLLTYEQI